VLKKLQRNNQIRFILSAWGIPQALFFYFYASQ
jgi:hypothetical protein